MREAENGLSFNRLNEKESQKVRWEFFIVDTRFLTDYIPSVEWTVEVTDEFEKWWDALDEEEQVSVDGVVGALEKLGPLLPHPYSSAIRNSRHGHMRELRIQHRGDPYRIFYAFDPRRVAILLLGGKKGGDDARWYREYIPIADRLYDDHLDALRREGLISEGGKEELSNG